jgi:hypothetical protein
VLSLLCCACCPVFSFLPCYRLNSPQILYSWPLTRNNLNQGEVNISKPKVASSSIDLLILNRTIPILIPSSLSFNPLLSSIQDHLPRLINSCRAVVTVEVQRSRRQADCRVCASISNNIPETALPPSRILQTARSDHGQCQHGRHHKHKNIIYSTPYKEATSRECSSSESSYRCP